MNDCRRTEATEGRVSPRETFPSPRDQGDPADLDENLGHCFADVLHGSSSRIEPLSRCAEKIVARNFRDYAVRP